jgi:hypothetical protein
MSDGDADADEGGDVDGDQVLIPIIRDPRRREPPKIDT